MTRDNEPAIEVEVVAIDGSAPPPPGHARVPTAGSDSSDDDDDDARVVHSWANWQRRPGQAQMLHPFWWPVFIVGGGLLLAVILAIGVCVVVLVVIYQIVRGLLRAVFSG